MNSEEYMKMQQSAADRVRDMQKRANTYTAPERAEKAAPAPPPAPPVRKGILSKGGELLKMLNFSGIEMDSDRALIAAMMLLLVSESEDELLILALLYIML